MDKIASKLNGKIIKISETGRTISIYEKNSYYQGAPVCGMVTGITRFNNMQARERFDLQDKARAAHCGMGIPEIVGGNNEIVKVRNEYYYIINRCRLQNENKIAVAKKLFGENCVECWID